MNRIIRAFAAFIVSICLILAPALSYAASPVGWSASPADIFMNGATATINAVKGTGSSALQSTIKHAPTAANVGKNLIRGGGAAALLIAVPQIIGAGVDWVLDPANNAVKYKNPAAAPEIINGKVKLYVANGACETSGYTAAAACSAWGDLNGGLAVKLTGSTCSIPQYGWSTGISLVSCHASYAPPAPDVPPYLYVPINTVAAKVISNAAAGNVPSQEFVKTVAIEDLESGVLDVPLNTNAVPKTDNPPVTDPNAPPIDPNAPPVPFDPSSIIAAIKSVMAAVVNMSGVLGAKIDALMIDLGLKHDEKLAADAANTAQIVAANDRTGAQVAAIAAAIADIEGNTLDGKVINEAIDRAIAAGHTDTASIVTAIEAIEGNTLTGEVINDAVDRVIANDNVNAQSAADAATAAAEAAKAADAANTAAVTDAIGAQTDAITEADPVTGEMSLKFPKFCSWALPVCTFTDWAMADPQLEEPEDTRPEIQDLTKYDTVDISQKYVTATGQCPPAADLNINFGVVKLSYEPLCIILDKLSGVIVAVAYISVGFMIIRTV